jgi:hypothetical protein
MSDSRNDQAVEVEDLSDEGVRVRDSPVARAGKSSLAHEEWQESKKTRKPKPKLKSRSKSESTSNQDDLMEIILTVLTMVAKEIQPNAELPDDCYEFEYYRSEYE